MTNIMLDHGITHARLDKANDRVQWTACGLFFTHGKTRGHPLGLGVTRDVDCMACVAWEAGR